MAETLGFVASVSTLSNCISTLIGFVKDFKNAPETLQRYKMVLEGIQKSSGLVAHLVEGVESIRTITTQANGEEVNLLEQSTRNIDELIKDVKQLIQRCEDSQSRGVKTYIQRLKSTFQRTKNSVDIVCSQDHFDNLIQAAKYVESSLHMALTTILLHHHVENKKEDLQPVLISLSEQMIKQSKCFKDINEICRRDKTDVFRFQNNVPIKPRIKFHVNRRASKASRSSIGVHDRPSEHPQRQNFIVEDYGSSQSSVSSIFQHSANENGEYLVMRNDGTTDFISSTPEKHTEPFDDIHANPLSPFQEAGLGSSSNPDPDLISESEDFNFSEMDDFETQTVTISSTPRLGVLTPPTDSVQLDILPEGLVFIDRAVDLTQAKSSSQSGFSFCTRTLIVHEDGSPSLILNEPCDFTTVCAHISLHIRNFDWAEQSIPCSLPVTIRHTTSGVLDVPDSEPLTLTAVKTGFGLGSRTLIVSNQGTCKQYSIPASPPFEAIPSNDNNCEQVGSDEEVGNSTETQSVITELGYLRPWAAVQAYILAR